MATFTPEVTDFGGCGSILFRGLWFPPDLPRHVNKKWLASVGAPQHDPDTGEYLNVKKRVARIKEARSLHYELVRELRKALLTPEEQAEFDAMLEKRKADKRALRNKRGKTIAANRLNADAKELGITPEELTLRRASARALQTLQDQTVSILLDRLHAGELADKGVLEDALVALEGCGPDILKKAAPLYKELERLSARPADQAVLDALLTRS